MRPEVPGYTVTEVVHASTPRMVWRATREDGTPVVLKTLAARYPAKRDLAELRREFALMARLHDPGVVRVHELVEYGSGNLAIVMELFGISLAQLLTRRDRQPLALGEFLDIAIRVARILGRLHERHLVHKDVVPRNLLIEPETGVVKVIDFGIASELTRERQAALLHRRLEGSLPYISPEQTGRMNRDLDYRSDYYSLGCSYFELLTGQLPFQARTLLGWVHQHISQPPPLASTVNPAVPEPLAQLVARLMAKNAEDRYQSTFGLVRDLEHCRDQLDTRGSIAPFSLGAHDVSRSFALPQKLFGRQAELDLLLSLFERAASGTCELCLVAGWSGVGKSALVGELSRTIVGERGHLVQGKFDQFQQSTPYAAVASAFRGLLQQVLGESGEALAEWRTALQTAVGVNGRLLTELLPELELVIGEQPPLVELAPAEARNRFQLVFIDFVRVFTERSPLVVFLDDLQWSDAPTLRLLERLVTARDLERLFVIGAYRDNHVDPGHPLALVLDAIGKVRPVETIALKPLEPSAVAALVADTVKQTPAQTQELHQVVHEKTRGNPFFATALLKSLYEAGSLWFEPDKGQWCWDLEEVRAADVGDNVVAFMVAGLKRLPEQTQELLRLAACIGNTFDLRTLAVVAGCSVEQASDDLREALQRNLVLPLSDDYRYVHHDGTAFDARYRFQHDRVQQAAYALIDDDRRQDVHLSIGRLLLQQLSAPELDERLLEVTGHLDQGRSRLTDPTERSTLAELNHRAAVRARASSAYEAALGYARIALELDPDPQLWTAVAIELQQATYLTGRYDEADDWSERLLQRAQTPLERAAILATRTRQYATIGRMKASIEAAIQGLTMLGIDFAPDPGEADLQAEIDAVETNRATRPIDSLIDAPPCDDEVVLQAIRLLMEIFAAAFLSGSGRLFPYLVLKLVNLSLKHGNCPESAFAYAAYAMLLCGALDDPATGLAYGRLGVAINERFDDLALRARVIYVYAMFVHHWSEPWASMTPWFERGIEAGYQSGDLLYLAYSAQDCVIWDPTLDLESAARSQRQYLAIVKDTGYTDSYDSGSLFLQMQRNFLGETRDRFSLATDDFDEAAVVAGMRERAFMTGIANHHIYKAEIHCLYEDFEGALVHIDAQQELLASAMSLPQSVRFHIIAFLVRAAMVERLPSRRIELAERMQESLDQMERWAAHCPGNFAHLAATMRAEQARLDGTFDVALGQYERAVQLASEAGHLRDEAVANELCGRFLHGSGLTKASEGYLRAAHHLFERWGASAKVRQLEERYPHLRAPSRVRDATTLRTISSSGSIEASQLDIASVLRASQAISGELQLDRLWRRTLAVLVENAGAVRGVFVGVSGTQLEVLSYHGPGQPPTTADDELPVSILRAVLRTRKAVVLGDARSTRRFASDAYLTKHQPRSVLCMPVGRKQTQGAIYLENAFTTNAFTEERVRVLELLSAQAAISTENAQLYEAQSALVRAQRRFVPDQFLQNLGHQGIANVELGESVAREMSVMFSDLRGFTPLAEKLGPQKVIGLLNAYFSSLEGPIANNGGFIDSFNGDEIMALFGVTPDRAVDGGVAMCRALEQFNARSQAEGGPTLRMGVGLNTGDLVLGTVGGQERLKCGVVGDTVNLASRIEQLTKTYDTAFLIGGQTFDGLVDPDRFSLRLVDRVAVKGKTEAVRLYEVLDAESDARRVAKEATRPQLAEAQQLYLARRFPAAVKVLDDAVASSPEDEVLQVLRERCHRYAEHPPPSEWGGYETLTHK